MTIEADFFWQKFYQELYSYGKHLIIMVINRNTDRRDSNV